MHTYVCVLAGRLTATRISPPACPTKFYAGGEDERGGGQGQQRQPQLTKSEGRYHLKLALNNPELYISYAAYDKKLRPDNHVLPAWEASMHYLVSACTPCSASAAFIWDSHCKVL